MKRILTSLIAVCLIISALASFTACEHKCEYSTAWTNDDNEHWHICNDAECTLVADKAAHTWDEGRMTTEPSQEADGVKTFTCTVCQKTRTEKVEFTGLSREAWNGVISSDTFENYTMKQTAIVKVSGVSVETTTTYYITETKMYGIMELAGEIDKVLLEGEEAEAVKEDFIDELLDMFDFDVFKYDTESKTYRVTKEIAIPGVDDSKTKDATVYFENGKPIKYTCTGTCISNGVEASVDYVAELCDYGTTEIPDTNGNI